MLSLHLLFIPFHLHRLTPFFQIDDAGLLVRKALVSAPSSSCGHIPNTCFSCRSVQDSGWLDFPQTLFHRAPIGLEFRTER